MAYFAYIIYVNRQHLLAEMARNHFPIFVLIGILNTNFFFEFVSQKCRRDLFFLRLPER
jgi:hypothetical protein